MSAGAGAIGTIYIIHFDRPYKHARHYVGWTDNLGARLARHRAGSGARLIEVVTGAGIGWACVLTFPGTRSDERKFKNRKCTPWYCPVCRAARVLPPAPQLAAA